MKAAHLAWGLVLLGAALSASLVACRDAASNAAGGTKSAAASAKPTTPPKMVLPFILDDYAKALQEARASKRPLFIETWAPW